MTNSIDGIRGIHNNPAVEGQNQNRTQAAELESQAQSRVSSAPTDSVVLTDVAAQMQKAEKVLAETPQVDKAKVEQIKASIADGSYQVNAEQVAEKLLRLEANMGQKS